MKKLIIMLALALASCVSEREVKPPVSGDGFAEVQVRASMPASTTVTTRGEVGTSAENNIDNIFVLVFKSSGELLYKGAGRGVVQSGTNGNIVSFKATLPIGQPYDFVVLANAADVLTGVKVGANPTVTKAAVRALIKEHTTAWSPTKGIPMWDEKPLTLAAEGTASFNLMRMLARINVEYTPASGTVDRFRMEKVRLYNYNTKALLVPADANLTGSGQTHKVTSPTLPADAGTKKGLALEYTDIANHNSCLNKIYAMEAATCGKYTDGDARWVDNPCLVIGGRYDTNNDGNYDDETTTWYRVDMIQKTTGNYLSLLRNFTYKVVITSVSGEGYDDPDVALKSAPVNIHSDILDWNDGEMDQVIFDGTSYLSVNKHTLELRRAPSDTRLADGSNTLDIKTDYTVSGFPERSGWHAEYYTDEAGTQKMTNPWLKLINGTLTDRGPVTGTPDDPAAQTFFAFEENTGDTNRTAWVYITAGRLRYRVKVVQKVLSFQLYEIMDDMSEVPRDSILFIIPKDRDQNRIHKARKFGVRWRPVDKLVRLDIKSPQPTNPFPPAWVKDDLLGAPVPCQCDVPGAFWDFDDGVGNTLGLRRFVVTPPAIDYPVNNQILERYDQLYDKESVYHFDLNNGGVHEHANIRMKQIYYNIVVETHRYRLDGKTQTLAVRSNTEWRIKKIEEHLYNNPPDPTLPAPVMLNLKEHDNLREGTTGGPKVTGDAVSFTTVDAEKNGPHNRKWGTVYVTFESPEGKLDDRTVELVFPPATRLVLGLGNTLDVRAFNIGVGTSYHPNSANRMLSSPYNYGSMDESVVKVEGLRILGYNATGEAASKPSPTIPDFQWYEESIRDLLNDFMPDVIVISSGTADGMIFSDNNLALLRRYLDNGGALVMCYHGGHGGTRPQDVAKVMQMAFGGTFTSSGASADVKASVGTARWYKLNQGSAYSTDPILNGKFGDIRGMAWGSHYHSMRVRTSKIGGLGTSLSNGKDGSNFITDTDAANFSTIVRHNTLNFMWIGNGCAMASYYLGIDESVHDPFRADPNNYFRPVPRPGYGTGANKTTTYNSQLIANTMAWALSVTNHKPPVGGY